VECHGGSPASLPPKHISPPRCRRAAERRRLSKRRRLSSEEEAEKKIGGVSVIQRTDALDSQNVSPATLNIMFGIKRR
jgi:hypothetical protein